ncbi:MAG: YbjN domain-containing protein [Pseudomonadota bacterium]
MDSATRDALEFDPSPIDLVESLAELRSWDVDRLGEDQIAMAVEGVWKTYSLSLAWCEPDETLRMVCTFDLDAEQARLPMLYEAIETANDRIWIGGFNLWREQNLMAYRYGLTLSGAASSTSEQVDAMLRAAVKNCERFYPAFHLIAHGEDDVTVESAMATALLEAAGRA